MAEILGMDGERRAESDLVEREKDEFISTLREILRQAEDGEIFPRQWLLIYEVTNPDNHNLISRRSEDSGLTCAESIFMAEVFKSDLLEHLKAEKNK